ncbi:FliA/WhiG family RNA polymerase sigma factor [Natribacillus halophilus]|uniref:RNA polymerase, sigma 28 subunit, SigD/FliA/WhiG n=1 Tax=Natribacillus halophilus TaxID=549003 RepID=A0A1G8PPI9_9BACI|nr:FliA/WhiG family RNA polymerase sigma factor [Natribacillus halophilus]SDI94268.1 RNA polymerase, sigma 28 subunit, SigD/FliA/WhiG [Natribacillus halophilus]
METTSEMEECWARWIKHEDRQAAEELIAAHVPLVEYHLQRIGSTLPQNVDRDELRSQGMYGLYDALLKFDHERDLKFYTYASFRVRGAMLDSLRKEDWLPRSSRDKAKKIDDATERLEQQKRRHVTEREVAEELDMPVADVLKTTAESYMAHLVSMEQASADDEEEEPYRLTFKDDNTPTPHEAVENNAIKEQLQSLISNLSEKERLVLSLFYYEELTLTEIGYTLRLSTSRISQIHSRALFRLKQAFQKENTKA